MTREDMQHLFQVDDKELALLNKFQDEHKKCSCGFAGDKFSYNFCPTSIGTVITVTCSCGKSLRLECFLESDDKEKQDFSVYTFRKAQDDNTNKIVKAILNMKNARIRRLYCHGEVRYEYLIAYFKGMAYATVDDQTSSRIWGAEEELFIECGGEVGDYITNRASVVLKKLTDEEAIDRYLQLFESWGS